VIKALVVHKTALLRGALVVLLSHQDDITVVADSDGAADLEAQVTHWCPDVIVIDLDVLEPLGVGHVSQLLRRVPTCTILALVHAGSARALFAPLARLGRRIGFVSDGTPPATLLDAVRRSFRGEYVVDPDVIRVLLTPNPLSAREVEVLRAVAQGHPLRVVASRLSLSHGTVRNYLSGVYAKTGARSRIEAVRVARQSGWI
jgi:two-component system response regulator DesR